MVLNNKDSCCVSWISVSLIIKALLMFMFIYDTNLSVFGMPTFFTTRRIVVFLLLLYFLLTKDLKKSFQKKDFGNCWTPFDNVLKFQYFIFVYSIILLFFLGRGSGNHIYESSFRLLLFGFLPIFLFKELFRNVDEFMQAILYATLLQSVFVIYSLVNPKFGMYLDYTFALDDDYVQRHRTGYAGGLNCITAPGALKFSMGLIASAYFCLKDKSIIHYALFVFLGVIDTMIARTGLLLSSCGLVVIILGSMKTHGMKSIFTVIVPICILGIGLYYFYDSGGGDDLFDFKRLKQLGRTENVDDGFFDGYFKGKDTVIPPLNFDTLIGIGVTSGVSGSGIRVNVDGGFIRLFAALGPIISLLFYVTLFFQCFKIRTIISNRAVRYIVTYFIIIILIGEFKEFTIYQQYMVAILFTIVALYEKNLINQKQKKCLQSQIK